MPRASHPGQTGREAWTELKGSSNDRKQAPKAALVLDDLLERPNQTCAHIPEAPGKGLVV